MGPKKQTTKTTQRTHEEPASEAAAIWVERTALHAWDKNPRKNEKAIPKVMESIKRFGFGSPILARKNGEIIAGHTRWAAAEALGLDRVPVRYLDLDPAEAHLLALADNKLGEVADWDKEVLGAVLSEYGLEDVDLAGWDSKELDVLGGELLRDNEVSDVEDVDPGKAPKRVAAGDVWRLGAHTLVCGDSEDPASWQACPDGKRIMITDPPYGVEYDAEWRKNAGLIKGGAFGAVQNDHRCDWGKAYANANASVGYVWFADTKTIEFVSSLAAEGYTMRGLIVWSKNKYPISRGHYHHQHEPCLYVVREGETADWCGGRKQTTVWEIESGRIDNDHSTSKPIECMARPMRNHAHKLVVDPFGGSGTTLLAAEQLGRTCFMIEIMPEYCDIVIHRWEKLTGKTAEKAS